jgi:two-component system chemotaxis response regulator CheB
MRVQQAEHYGVLRLGGIYVAPPHQHLELTRNGADYVTVTSDLPPLHYHRPSVDVLFHSVARSAGANAIGVILTGMGCDGAAGITAMRNRGAITIAQDEASSVVWGMPGAAVKSSGVDYVLPITDIANTINDLMSHRQRTGRIAQAVH